MYDLHKFQLLKNSNIVVSLATVYLALSYLPITIITPKILKDNETSLPDKLWLTHISTHTLFD